MTSPQTVTKRKFKIKTLSDNVYDFQVDENMKVSDVKVLIAEKTGVPAQRQRLVFMAKLLENQKTIGSYVTEDDKTVHLMAKIVESDSNNNQTQSQPQQQQQQAQQQQQQQQNNPMAGLLGNFSGLLGFNPMQMIQQIASQPQGGVFNIMRSTGPNGLQMGQSGQGFGGLGNSGQSNQGQSANNPTQANQQPAQQQSQTSEQSQQNQSPPHQHHHNHHHPPPNVGTLPFNLLQNLGLSLNQTMGPGATFPGPPLPPIQNRNNVQILGAYLSQWHFQMTRLLPYINRLAELLQREPLMNNTNDRALTQQMVNRIPHLFETVANSTRAVIPVYSNLRLGNSVGQFTLGNNQNNPNQQQQQQQSNANNASTNSNIGNNNPFGIIGQPVVSVQVLSNEQLPANLSSNISSLFGNLGNPNNSNNQGSAPGSQQGGQNAFMNNLSSSLNDILPNLQGLIGSFMPGFVGSPPQPQTQPQSQPQAQPQNAPQSSPPTVSQQSNPNPVSPQQSSSSTPVSQPPISSPSSQPQPQLPSQTAPVSAPVSANPMQALNNFMSNSNLSSMLTPENINLATSSNLRYMISEGHAISTQNESIYSLIFGDITGGQLIQLFTSSNYSFFDNRRADFRRGLLTSLSRYQNSTEKLIEKIVSDILPLLVSSELLQASVEGFDPELVARQILTDHLKKIIELILDNQEDFSGRLIKQIKGMIGELIYELQEGSSGNDVRFIIECIKKSGARVMDPYLMGMSGLVFMLFDKGMYGAYQDVKQAKEKSMKMTEDDHEKERQLLQRIQKYAEEDRKELEKFVKEERSQYFK